MQNYSNFQKFLHDLVLGNQIINKSIFEVEKILYLKKNEIKINSHVFITALPRSGTTSLLNFLYSSNDYASLTYRYMPFILSPNLSKFFIKKKKSVKERLHGDGINYDINSPEALDEVFFNNNKEFIKEEFVNYIKLILYSEKKKKYLSKNNLNFKRVNLISSLLPNSKFLIPIREPLQHANSLLNQHHNFSQLQQKDDFIRRYMNYIGHNEFGLNHISWNSPINFNDFKSINYWLEQWCLFYQNILDKYKSYKNCFFIIYEQLSNQNYVKMLLEKVDLNNTKNLNLSYFKNSNNENLDIDYSKKTYEQAKEIYMTFKNIFL